MTLQGKGDFAGVIKLNRDFFFFFLRRDYPGLSRGHNIITRVLVRNRQEGQSQRRWYDRSRGRGEGVCFDVAVLLALMMEEGAVSQETPA